MFNVPICFEIGSGLVSLDRLRRALWAVIFKHEPLRTRLIFDEDIGVLRQEVLDNFKFNLCSFNFSTINQIDDLDKIMIDEEINTSFFDLSAGKVVRRHIIRKNRVDNDHDYLVPADIIIFNFHHIAIDGFSTHIFRRDLQRAYSTNVEKLESCSLNYIDYSIHERQMNMEEAKSFWSKHLQGFSNNLFESVYDRLPTNGHTRSGHSFSASIDLSKNLINKINEFITTYNCTLFQFGLAAYYAFLFKLSGGEQDICIASYTANRYRSEIQDMIGFFVNVLPQRLIVDPKGNFICLVECVKKLCLEILPHSHLPYHDIVTDWHASPVQTLFIFDYWLDTVQLDKAILNPISQKDTHIATFDLVCSMQYHPRTNKIVCIFNGSTDVFYESTINSLVRRFELALDQLLSLPTIYQISLLLPEENKLLEQLNNINDHISDVNPIHCDFIKQIYDHPQQISLVLDEQSLTYAELIYATQNLALHLIDTKCAQKNDIICVCVERSLEMPIAIFAILMCGAIYCPLTPNHPEYRLVNLVQKTNARCILTHEPTDHKFDQLSNRINLSNHNFASNSIDIDRLSNIDVSVDQVAYIIFTSGSTGEPKGVSLQLKIVDSID